MRVLGADLGTRRIGLALSDRGGVLATPLGVLARSGDTDRDHAELARRVAEEEAEAVVIGLPVSLSGDLGPSGRAVAEEIEELRRVLPVPVHTQDERFSTVVAVRALRQASGGRAVRASRRRRGDVDAAAASVFLQAWLDARNARPEP